MKKYDTCDSFDKCRRLECFVPFEGNGRRICRLYELGRRPPPDQRKRKRKRKERNLD